ncbi:NADPH-dependent FMN reductase [Legionella bozemanae]|uniref:Chromate reductase, Class I, flavoprotein n=1 Tax=Legionella bozemanae TaxID=447 RepID=A0A0W0RU78_LEGBO|nr:NAD(P)H-dependent oxidoreductase [Legionella bozemanae]KTC74589.1 chromate reductase, Class I, flavoprotein [Legionella bozemanae]STO32553.1 NADPH azoreductase [Legionella bozemanae]
MSKKIAVIVGSLRKESYNRKMAKVLISLAPKSLNLQIVEIGDLPLYNQDLDDENRPPAPWVQFREQMKTYQGVLFVTPEYNRSVPGVLKNAVDVGSRPYGKSIWSKLPGAVISVSPGAIGGFGANNHLRQSFVFLDIPTLQQPETYIGMAADLFDEQGNIKKEDTQKFLQKFMDAYADWVELNTKG